MRILATRRPWGDHQFKSWAVFFSKSLALVTRFCLGQHSHSKLPVFFWRLPQTSGSGYDVIHSLRHDYITQGKQNWSMSNHNNNVTTTMSKFHAYMTQPNGWEPTICSVSDEIAKPWYQPLPDVVKSLTNGSACLNRYGGIAPALFSSVELWAWHFWQQPRNLTSYW